MSLMMVKLVHLRPCDIWVMLDMLIISMFDMIVDSLFFNMLISSSVTLCLSCLCVWCIVSCTSMYSYICIVAWHLGMLDDEDVVLEPNSKMEGLSKCSDGRCSPNRCHLTWLTLSRISGKPRSILSLSPFIKCNWVLYIIYCIKL